MEAETSMCYNVLDRHEGEKPQIERFAYYWCKGDRVSIYLPMIPELVYTMLACCQDRRRSLHCGSVCRVSPLILCEDYIDAQSGVLVTTDGVYRGRLINLKQIAERGSGECLQAKGVLHTVAGYLLYSSLTFKCVFDHHHDDVYWCTADIGWITGHSYITYGPLANGATGVLFEGIPIHPHVGRFWEIIEKHKVTKFYTAPTAIRLLMKYGREPLQKYDLSSLRILGTVGEPINPEAWQWYHEVVGQGRCPVVDTFWQTETGGHVLTPLPAATPLKPGSATFPFFGVEPTILNEHGEELEGEAEGYLVFRRPWPGIMRTVYRNQERFENTYFKKFPGFYVTGDGCRRDKDGYYWITGRIDDMLNVSGHLMSTAEVEAALTEHPAVAEAAVVSRPHKVKGECLYCFVSLKDSREFNHTLVEELKRLVREKIGPIATPDFIQNAPALPKTRSGKIMRRILRQVARNEKDLGDLSTLADPKVVEVLFSQRCEAAA
ncbi:acetyl-coenzyme A synthetase, cytoplasmic-like protein [Lates japonicus]|uniref:acetate--CoA ligase n=1 Tax=Lates japonicus TaxID=270547 RepID=A0AAD3MHG1_LATJO|nr:acetyl-coenzyme A synthetase, cytoplasmic-like protein [Lates japonicus]